MDCVPARGVEKVKQRETGIKIGYSIVPLPSLKIRMSRGIEHAYTLAMTSSGK